VATFQKFLRSRKSRKRRKTMGSKLGIRLKIGGGKPGLKKIANV
jgi:hypothetical protein